MDDGLLCALGDGAFYLTSTSGGAERMDDRACATGPTGWTCEVHVLDQTAQLGRDQRRRPARARPAGSVCTDDAIDADAFPYPGHAEHHGRGRPVPRDPERVRRRAGVRAASPALARPRAVGRACCATGAAWDLRPHGLDALELLRLEKGHVYLGQDTLPDDTPAKLGMSWAVAMDKPWFVGKRALERMAELPLERTLRRAGVRRPPATSPSCAARRCWSGGQRRRARHVGGALDRCWVGAIGLGWIRAVGGRVPDELDVAGDDGVACARRADAVLRPRGGAAPWLSSGPSRPPWSQCSPPPARSMRLRRSGGRGGLSRRARRGARGRRHRRGLGGEPS